MGCTTTLKMGLKSAKLSERAKTIILLWRNFFNEIKKRQIIACSSLVTNGCTTSEYHSNSDTDARFDPVISTVKVVNDALGFLLHGLVAMYLFMKFLEWLCVGYPTVFFS